MGSDFHKHRVQFLNFAGSVQKFLSRRKLNPCKLYARSTMLKKQKG